MTKSQVTAQLIDSFSDSWIDVTAAMHVVRGSEKPSLAGMFPTQSDTQYTQAYGNLEGCLVCTLSAYVSYVRIVYRNI